MREEQAEAILNQLGIPISNAIGMFLKQVVMQRGVPFDLWAPVCFRAKKKTCFISETGHFPSFLVEISGIEPLTS